MTAPALATRPCRDCWGVDIGNAQERAQGWGRCFWSRAAEFGFCVETEDARGRNAWSMKRQRASSERKRARIPSRKAGAEGGREGAVGRPHSQGRTGRDFGPWINCNFPPDLLSVARSVIPALKLVQTGGPRTRCVGSNPGATTYRRATVFNLINKWGSQYRPHIPTLS